MPKLASLLTQDKTTRHSRESGNPFSYTRLQILWIPAFAIMMDFLSISKLSRLKREAPKLIARNTLEQKVLPHSKGACLECGGTIPLFLRRSMTRHAAVATHTH